jgi:DAK2 domain fusion protein YloV
MNPNATINGQDFRDMFAAATSWLEKSVSDIDALNVFPVPDGDTGTNMLLTMRSTIEEAYKVGDPSISSIAQAMATGALMGARGNSGVILSQIWSGMALGLCDKVNASGVDIAEALVQASEVAYKGLNNPVEGTILTVMKDSAKAACDIADKKGSDVATVLESAVNAASESVANTPALLPVLKEAGVVDAGGQGLFTLLDGALRYLRGEAEAMQFRKPQLIASKIPLTPRTITAPERVGEDEIPFGYCTEFLLKGQELDPDKLRKRLKRRGQSLIVVGDHNTVRVHIHTLNPGKIIQLATSLGTVHSVNMRNMDEQHQDFLEMQKARAPLAGVEIIAVAAGEGLAEVFTSLGVAGIVTGGQTMNPSTKEILQAVSKLASSNIIILPNNKNIVMTAEKVRQFTDKHVHVVPSKTIPQGVAAILAFDYEADFDTNTRLMTQALSSVKSVEITRAIRTTKINGLKIKKKQAIGILNDGEIISVADEPEQALYKALERVSPEKSEVLTIYYGADTGEPDSQKAKEDIEAKYPHLQVEMVKGGQPHYNYIVSVE